MKKLNSIIYISIKIRQGDSMSEVSVKSLNCPNCGAQLDITQKTADIVFCSSCGSRCVISGLTHDEESPAENQQQPVFKSYDDQASQQQIQPVLQKPDGQQYESPKKVYYSSSTGYSNSKSDKGKTKASIYDLGIISLLLCWFPLLNFPLSIAGIVLAFLGLNKKDTSKGKAVFVMICAVVSFIFAIKVNSAILKPSSNEKSTTVSQQEDTLAEDIAASSEETTTASLPYELVDGMSELQSLYLWIDRTCSEDEIIAVAEMAGFEVKKESDIGFDIVYISASELINNGVYNLLSFGPGLISDGEIIIDENDEVGRSMASNPRTAIGMIDDNHYIFVVSDGRTSENDGLSLYELALFMKKLGCKVSYNLDGGGSSTMYFNGNIINNPTGGIRSSNERSVSDIVYIGY